MKESQLFSECYFPGGNIQNWLPGLLARAFDLKDFQGVYGRAGSADAKVGTWAVCVESV